MFSNDDLRLLIHLDDEEGQGFVALVAAPPQKDTPELLPVDGVICLLEVDEGCIVPPLLALPRVDLSEESRYVGGRRGALLEARFFGKLIYINIIYV